MAGKCIEKLPHSCGTRDGLQVFEKEDGTYDGYCYLTHIRINLKGISPLLQFKKLLKRLNKSYKKLKNVR